MDKRLIVIKDEGASANPDVGLVIPLAHLNSDGSVTELEDGEFPNGGIWVSKGFQTIAQQYKMDEIFILNDFFDGDDDNWKINPRLQKHYTLGSKTDGLERNQFIPILNIPLPDIASGAVDYAFELPANNFFIENEDFIYGPFKAIKQSDSWMLSPLSSPSLLQLNTDYVAKAPRIELSEAGAIVQLKIRGANKKFIKNLKDVSLVQYEQIDYISDVKLISFFCKHGFGRIQLLGKSEAQKLSSGIEDFIKKSKVTAQNSRMDRIRKLLSNFLDQSDYGHELVNEFLADTKDGRLYLDSYFEKNKEYLLKEKNDELEVQFESKMQSYKEKIDKIENEINKKEEERKDLLKNIENEKQKAKDRIEKIRMQSDEDAHLELLNKQRELTEVNQELESKIKSNKEKLQKFMDENENVDTYEKIQEELKYSKRRHEELNTENRAIQSAIDQQKIVLASPQLPDKLAEISTLTNILRGTKNTASDINSESIDIKRSSYQLNKKTRVEYINSLVDSFNRDGGRIFSFDEVANLVINISQSFLTILSGPPGTGKTSTAIRLAKHMHLSNNEKSTNLYSNFLNIAVGRAWVSGRDILGFYNSLKDTYQPSRTGLYEFLTKNNKNNDFLKLVLLDEANLSSIEHYWSDFLGMCDPEGANKSLDSGIPNNEKRYFPITDNLRFIATINNDSTTEKLSPRLIDRVPIIKMDYSLLTNKSLISNEVNFDGAVSHDSLCDAFNVQNIDASLTSEEDSILENIIEILSRPLPRTTTVRVSQRKINAIRRYCFVANDLENMRISPLDYAINQHILPLIDGYGSSFKERLIDLEQKLAEFDFSLSKSALKEIINQGDIYGNSYSYF